MIYSQLYDITRLINDTYGIPILAAICWILTSVIYAVYEGLTEFKMWGAVDIMKAIGCSVLLFKVTLFCHRATNEASYSRILVQKLLLEGNCKTECVKELKMFSHQLQVMKNEYSACGYFSLNLSLFASVIGVIVSYIIIAVQIK
jgi:hypothetical protein